MHFFYLGEGIDKNNSPLRIQTVVRRTKFTVPEGILENGRLKKTELDEISPAKESATRHKKSKPRDSLDHTAGQKPRPRKLSHQSSCNGFTPTITNDFPPTPVESSAFIMPSPKDVFFPAHNSLAAPVLTPPVSPAVASGISRSGQVHVTYSGLSDKGNTKTRQSCLYSANDDANLSSDDIDRLVEQHFNNCGLGGFVHSSARRETNGEYHREVRNIGVT